MPDKAELQLLRSRLDKDDDDESNERRAKLHNSALRPWNQLYTDDIITFKMSPSDLTAVVAEVARLVVLKLKWRWKRVIPLIYILSYSTPKYIH